MARKFRRLVILRKYDVHVFDKAKEYHEFIRSLKVGTPYELVEITTDVLNRIATG